MDATPKSCYFQSLFNVYILAHKPYSFCERSLKGIILHVEIESLQQNTNAVAVITVLKLYYYNKIIDNLITVKI